MDGTPQSAKLYIFLKTRFSKIILIAVIYMDLIKKIISKQAKLESYYLWLALFMVGVFLLAFGVYRLPELL